MNNTIRKALCRANPKLKLPKGWGQGASPRVPRPEQLFMGSEDGLAHEDGAFMRESADKAMYRV
jgi:hypothetical protein